MGREHHDALVGELERVGEQVEHLVRVGGRGRVRGRVKVRVRVRVPKTTSPMHAPTTELALLVPSPLPSDTLR